MLKKLAQGFLVALGLYLFSAQAVFAQKVIKVDVAKQLLTAWENEKMVYQTKVSTGLVQTPTPKGTFSVIGKLPKRNMRGFSRVYGRYYHPNVPDVLWFKEGGYAIHGAYWHNKFGRRASNGCINLPLKAAKWMYAWAPVGTRVEVF